MFIDIHVTINVDINVDINDDINVLCIEQFCIVQQFFVLCNIFCATELLI